MEEENISGEGYKRKGLQNENMYCVYDYEHMHAVYSKICSTTDNRKPSVILEAIPTAALM